MKTLRELITAYAESKDWDQSQENDALYETFEDCSETVWESSQDRHRWYSLFDVIRRVPDGKDGYRYFKDQVMDVHGDGCRSDCGWEAPNIDEIVEVFPKQVVKTIYVTADKIFNNI